MAEGAAAVGSAKATLATKPKAAEPAAVGTLTKAPICSARSAGPSNSTQESLKPETAATKPICPAGGAAFAAAAAMRSLPSIIAGRLAGNPCAILSAAAETMRIRAKSAMIDPAGGKR